MAVGSSGNSRVSSAVTVSSWTGGIRRCSAAVRAFDSARAWEVLIELERACADSLLRLLACPLPRGCLLVKSA